jgi:hypothetical protein
MKKLLFFILFGTLTNVAFSQSFSKRKHVKVSYTKPPKKYSEYYVIKSKDGKIIDTVEVFVGQPKLVKSKYN